MQPSTDLLAKYQRRLLETTWTANNVRSAFSTGVLVRRDVDKVYRGLYMQAVVRLERTLEDLLIGLMSENISHPRATTPHQKFASKKVASHILNRGRYEDLLPIEKLEKVSQIFFVTAGNPFMNCPGAIKQEMVKVLTIRNYIAHESRFSEEKWRSNVVLPTILPVGRRDLLAYFQHTHAGAIDKFEFHMGEMLKCVRYFCT